MTLELKMNGKTDIEFPASSDIANSEEISHPVAHRRANTKEVHARVPIPNYQYLDQLAIRYGMRSLSGAVNFLIEFHRESQTPPTLGPASRATKQLE